MKRVRRPVRSLDDLLAHAVPEPTTGCWLWAGTRAVRDYGRTWAGGKQMLAHRVSWELANGRSAGDLYVCHKCDTPSCVNPDHLFLGDQSDNMRDAAQKGRMPRGSRASRAVLTEAQVGAIRARLAAGASHRVLAAEYGVGKSSIGRISCGDGWRHVGPAPRRKRGRIGDSHPQAKLTEVAIRDIRRRIGRGEMQREIAAFYGVAPSRITNIKKRREWSHVP